MINESLFKLAPWYASEEAKRKFGTICRAACFQGKTVHLLGTPAEPLLELKRSAVRPGDEEMSIDEARADWSNVTLAAAIYGTRFSIQIGKSGPVSVLASGRTRPGPLPLAILSRHPRGCHPAERYFRSSSRDVEQLAQQIEALAHEVRKLSQTSSPGCTGAG